MDFVTFLAFVAVFYAASNRFREIRRQIREGHADPYTDTKLLHYFLAVMEGLILVGLVVAMIKLLGY